MGAYLLPASYLQRRILEHVGAGPYADIVSRAWLLRGALDAGALQRALAAVAARHETLRTGLETVDGVAMQRVDEDATLEMRVIRARGRSLTRLAVEAAEAPFELARPPLVRVRLLRTGPQEHVLLLVAGHAVWDAVSTAVFARDLFALYAEERCGLPADLPPLRVQFADLVAADSRPPDPRAGAHWRARLATASARAPGDLARRDHDPPMVEWGRFGGPGATTIARLAAVARAERATLGIALVAAYAATLAHVCGVERPTFGLLHANRDTPESRPLIGYCVDAMLLPVGVAPGRSYRELVRATAEQVLEDYGWRLPIAAQLDCLAERGAAAIHELILNPLPELPLAPAPSAPGLEVTALRTPKRGYSADAAWPLATLLVTLVRGHAGRIALDVEYDPGVVPGALVDAIAGHLSGFLDLAAARPDAEVGSIAALAERRTRLRRDQPPGAARRGWGRA